MLNYMEIDAKGKTRVQGVKGEDCNFELKN